MGFWTLLLWLLIGILLTVPFRGLLRRNTDPRTRLAAIGLVLAAGVYVISGWLSGHLAREVGGLLIFGGLAVMAVGHMPQVAILGWLGHVAWDVLGMLGITGHALPAWYPPLCIGFDLAIALMLLGALWRDGPQAATA